MESVEILLLACAFYWLIFSLTIKIDGKFIYCLLFKAIPFFTGVAVGLIAMNMMGWVNIWQIQ